MVLEKIMIGFVCWVIGYAVADILNSRESRLAREAQEKSDVAIHNVNLLKEKFSYSLSIIENEQHKVGAAARTEIKRLRRSLDALRHFPSK